MKSLTNDITTNNQIETILTEEFFNERSGDFSYTLSMQGVYTTENTDIFSIDIVITNLTNSSNVLSRRNFFNARQGSNYVYFSGSFSSFIPLQCDNKYRITVNLNTPANVKAQILAASDQNQYLSIICTLPS
jgi:hypothetical protein